MYQQKYQTVKGFYGEVKENLVEKHFVEPDSNPNKLNPNGVKISCLVAPDPSDDELQYLNQMGVSHCYTWVDQHQANTEYLSKLRQKIESFNITLYSVGYLRVAKNANIILGTDQREQMIQEYKDWLKVCSESQVKITIFTWEPCGVSSSHENFVRGNAIGRATDTTAMGEMGLKFGREYQEEELWENMKIFLDAVLPVAEKLDVKLALHPNDPPTKVKIYGVPSIMRSREAYERVFEIANNSPALGMEFCCGCWLEGGKQFGNLLESLQSFIQRKKVLIIHLRNVTSVLPVFTETFIDDGYGDIFAICRQVVENDYAGTIILDHSPQFVGGNGNETAFAIGYIKASIRAAQAYLKPRPENLTDIIENVPPKDKPKGIILDNLEHYTKNFN